MNVDEESETRIECNTKQVQHEKMQYEENMESERIATDEKECNMKKVQHEKCATRESCNMEIVQQSIVIE